MRRWPRGLPDPERTPMTEARLSCPYCNATVPPPDPVPANRRVVCPLCGESFPLRASAAPGPDGRSAAATEEAAEALLRQRAAREAEAKRSIRRAAVVVVALVLLGI